MPSKVIAAVVFVGAYMLLMARRGRPVLVAWSGAAILLGLRVVTPLQALRSINPNVIGILLGTMILSCLFIESKVPAFLAGALVNSSGSVAVALLAVCALSSAVSAFIDNVATVLMIAPIALEVSKSLCVSPVPFVIGIAVSSNLQGASTLVGDSTSILLASAARMNFVDFIWMQGRPGIFFAVQVGAVCSLYVLYRVFRRYRGRLTPVAQVAVTSWVPTILLSLMMVTMALASFISKRPDWTIGAIALAYGVTALIWSAITRNTGLGPARDLDWTSIFLLAGLFVLIGSLATTGIVEDIAGLISTWTRGNPFLAYNVIVWASVLFSAFVDNIPYTMAMLPVVQRVSASVGTSPYVMLFGLLLGATLGGNITPLGASANVVGVSILRKNGYKVSFREFFRIGLPFTLAAVLAGSLLNWLVWRSA